MTKQSLFNGFSASLLKSLSDKIQEIRVSPEDVIIKADAYDDCSIYIVLEGEITLRCLNNNTDQ